MLQNHVSVRQYAEWRGRRGEREWVERECVSREKSKSVCSPAHSIIMFSLNPSLYLFFDKDVFVCAVFSAESLPLND